MKCSQPRVQVEGTDLFNGAAQKKFLSNSEVVIFSGYNDYKQDWFVGFLYAVLPDRKWVWGQEVAYFQRPKEPFRKTWGFITCS